MHIISSGQDRLNRKELDSSICDDKHFTAAAHFLFEYKT